MNEDVILLLLGANAGAYALAASFGEYGIPVTVMDESVPPVFFHTAFVSEVRCVPGLGYRGILMRALGDFYEKYAGRTLILLPTTAELAARVYAEEKSLSKMYLLPVCHIPKASVEKTPTALLLTYTDHAGALHAHYGTVVAAGGEEPLAVIPEPLPAGLLSHVEGKEGIALYGIDETGETFLYSREGTVSPLIAFPSAADASLVEWLLSDLVTCEPIEDSETVPEAVFSLLPYRRLRSFVLPSEKERVACLTHRHLYLSLFPYRGEKKDPRARLILRRYMLENWQKKTKIKK